MKQRIQAVLLALLAVAVMNPAAADEWHYSGVDRIVAMSDVHGAYDAMVRTLANAGLVGEDLGWTGASSHLVIVGDLLDRGPESRAAMDILMRLEGEAAAAGGKVHVLVGNHEAMNLIGDLRYVSDEEYRAFAADETAEERARWFEAYAEREDVDADQRADLKLTFDEHFPAGFFAHRRAFDHDGKYGEWLLNKPAIVVINGTAFVHGGVSPLVGEIGLEGVNGMLIGELNQYVRAISALIEAGELLPTDSYRDHEYILDGFMAGLETSRETVAAVEAIRKLGASDLHASDGPLWYRGNVACSRLVEEDRLLASLQRIGADRVVIGHTPTPTRRILQRMDGRIIEVDTGMLNSHYRGKGNALVIEGDRVATVNENSQELVAPGKHPRRVGNRPGASLSAEQLEQLLQTGDIVGSREHDSGAQLVQISDGQETVEALFARRDGRGFFADVAAYRLDRILELNLVPVAVVREVDGKEGSVQFVPDEWLNEKQRGATGRGSSAQCGLDLQWAAMYVFDSLIYNERRSLPTMLYSPDIWQLVLVGHSHAFSTKKGRPRHLASVQLVIGDAWRAAMTGLTAESLEASLGDVLDSRRRRALLARRDKLLE